MIVFAELFRVYGKDIAVGDIVKSGIFGEDTLEAAARIEERYSEYEKSSATFHLEFEDINEYSAVIQMIIKIHKEQYRSQPFFYKRCHGCCCCDSRTDRLYMVEK